MPKNATRKFKAHVAAVKLKATWVLNEGEVTAEDAQIIITLKMLASKTNVRLLNFLHACQGQSTVDVQVESAQLELLDL